LLKANPNKIDWDYLSLNPNKDAIHLLEQNYDKIKSKINWHRLSENPNGIHILKQNMDKINWSSLARNPSIFEIDNKQYKIDITEKAVLLDKLTYK
jgi:hypothetical protein